MLDTKVVLTLDSHLGRSHRAQSLDFSTVLECNYNPLYITKITKMIRGYSSKGKIHFLRSWGERTNRYILKLQPGKVLLFVSCTPVQ